MEKSGLDEFVSVKLCYTGSYLELFRYYHYDCSFKKGIPRTRVRKVHNWSLDELMEKKRVYLRGVVGRLRRLINVNAAENTVSFVTFTFADNMIELGDALYYWNKFIKRLKYAIRADVKYVAVIEFQNRGSIHYHALFFGLPYIDNNELAAIWDAGFIKINLVNFKKGDVVGYLLKYMIKNTDDPRILTHRAYLCSKGLKKPRIETDSLKIAALLQVTPRTLIVTKDVENKWIGAFRYDLFRLW